METPPVYLMFPMRSMEDAMEKDTAESVTKRRRRRGRAPVEVVARAGHAGARA